MSGQFGILYKFYIQDSRARVSSGLAVRPLLIQYVTSSFGFIILNGEYLPDS